MNITFLTPSVSRTLGGIYEAERHLALSLAESTPTDVHVVGLEDEHTQNDVPEWTPLKPQVLPVRGPTAFGYSPNMASVLEESRADLVHLHALWMYTSVASHNWSEATNRPHIVSPHGMLDSWAVRNSRWKKRIAGWLYENRNLRTARCIHALNVKEYEAIREYGLDTPICIVPNGIRLPRKPPPEHPPWGSKISDDNDVLLFLGRIHPKKGLDVLVEAWDALSNQTSFLTSDWTVGIVGWDDGGHTEQLQREIHERGLEDDLVLLGPMFGNEKHAAFSHASAFILPSFSEGLPMAILEAWSYGLPVLMTSACNLAEGFETRAAFPIDPNAEVLQRQLEEFLSLPSDKHVEMGRNGRKLVEKRFTWPQIAEQMYEVYRWAIGESKPPETVHFD